MSAVSSSAVFAGVREVARRTGLSKSWLEHARARGEGPPAYRVGGRVLYDLAEVDSWVRAQRVGGDL